MSTRIKTLDPKVTEGISKELFNAVEKKLGFIPNLIKVLGNSPSTLQAYLSLGEIAAGGNFSNKFREQLALTIAEKNTCNYCLSAHTAIAKLNKIDETEIEKNRLGISTDAKTQAGLQFAQTITANRGLVTDEDITKVREAGYSDSDILEVILHVVYNTLTNYVNHIAETQIDFPKVTAGKFEVEV